MQLLAATKGMSRKAVSEERIAECSSRSGVCEGRLVYWPVRFRLSHFFLGGRQPAWPGSLFRNSENLLLSLILLLFLSLFLLLFLFLGLALTEDSAISGRTSKPREDEYCPRGASPPTMLGNFRGLQPQEATSGSTPTPSPNRDISLIPRDFVTQALPQDGSGPLLFPFLQLCPSGYHLPSPPGLWKPVSCPRGTSPPPSCFTLLFYPHGSPTVALCTWHCLCSFVRPWAWTLPNRQHRSDSLSGTTPCSQ
jgi:hypothetical protein